MGNVNVSDTGAAVASHDTVILAAENISKRYGLQQVLRDVSLSFALHEVVLLLGPNGAGKSTLLRVLSGLARPDAGRVLTPSQGRIGFASHHTLLYGRLSVRENIRLHLQLSPVERRSVDDVLGAWDLQDVASKTLCDLSKGNQARAALARTFLGDPSVVLLDEPSSNLDQKSTTGLLRIVADRSRFGSVIIATHDIHRLRAIATRVVVMDRGRVLADSGPHASAEVLDAVVQRYMESNR
jgi:ABC-2 type transport system ATP-binding protein